MQSKLAITLMSSALVLGVGLIGWQAWTGNQMKTQLDQLQAQLEKLHAQQPATAPAQVAVIPGYSQGSTTTPAPRQAAPLAQVTPVLPGGGASPVNPPGGNQPDPFGFFGGGDPFAEFDRIQQQMHERMQQLMSGSGFADPFLDFDAFGPGGFGFSSSFGLQNQPQFSYEETGDAYVVTVDIPEDSNIELNTEVNGRELTIEGKVTVEENSSNTGSAFTSRQTQQFAQTFSLPDDVDPLGITNETRDSKVIITIPRTVVPSSLAGPGL
jgi:HSP20 family molecular chaperone IbpA